VLKKEDPIRYRDCVKTHSARSASVSLANVALATLGRYLDAAFIGAVFSRFTLDTSEDACAPVTPT
jgi:hypothetical protein